MYYDDYDNLISEEDLKTDFHMALDDIIDAEVEKMDADYYDWLQHQDEAVELEAEMEGFDG